MKKKIIFLLLLLSICFFTKNVFADEVSCSMVCQDQDLAPIKTPYDNGTPVNTCIHKCGNPKKLVYCVDPVIDSAESYEKITFTPDSTNKLKAAKDYGLLYILNSDSYKGDGDDNVATKTTALRLYVIGFELAGRTEDFGTTLASYASSFRNLLGDDSAFDKQVKKLWGSNYDTNIGTLEGYVGAKYDGNTSEPLYSNNGSKVLDNAIALLKEGVNAAYEYYTETTPATPSINISKVKSLAITDYDGLSDKTSVKLNVIKFERKNLTNEQLKEAVYVDTTYNNNNVKVEFLGASSSASEKVSDYKTVDESFYSENETFYLGYLSYIVDESKDACEANLTIEYLEPSGLKKYTGYYYKPLNKPLKDNGIEDTSRQRFYSGAESGDINITKKVDIPLNDACSIVCDPKLYGGLCENKDIEVDANNIAKTSYAEGIYNGQDQVSRCVINSADVAGNSYKLTSDILASSLPSSDNPYCSVYCKEDYTFKFPYKLEMKTNGRYLKFGVGITGSLECYTSRIDRDQARIDKDFNHDNSTKIDKYLNECTNWKLTTANYNPTLNYTYGGDEEKDWNNDNNKLDEISKTESDVTTKYCKSINPQTYECTEETNKDAALYVSQIISVSSSYETPKKLYYREEGTGKVFINPRNVEKYSSVNGLPISINTANGTYTYKITVNNLGTYFANGETGRISNSIMKAESKESSYSCTYDVGHDDGGENTCKDKSGKKHNLNTECTSGESQADCKARLCPSGGGGDSTLYCVKLSDGFYHVCDDKECGGKINTNFKADRAAAVKSSSENVSCCPNCTIVCVGSCIYDIRDPQKFDFKPKFRTVTTGNINPNNRTLGYNWNVNNTDNKNVANKAIDTITEIQSRANSKATRTSPDVKKASESYVMKVSMTPELTKEFRSYNEKNSYDNKTVECKDYKISEYTNKTDCEKSGYIWKDNSCVSENILCSSSYLSKLMSDDKFKGLFDAPNRNNSKTSEKETTSGENVVTNDYWTIYKFTTLDSDGDGIPDIGPSWK